MRIPEFQTEHFYARYEFSSRHLLSTSDCESVSVAELLTLAGRSLDDLGSVTLGYTESAGDPQLRRAIASSYDTIEPDGVLELNAPIEGIYIAMGSLLDPGDRAIVLTPRYDALENVPRHFGARVETWSLQKRGAQWGLDLEALERLLEDPTKLVVVNFPHNPTGFLPTPEELSSVVECCRAHGAWLFSDEMYRGLELGGVSPLPSVADLYDRSVVLSGLSKSHGLPGLRSGWLVLRDLDRMREILNWKFYTSICPPAPIEALALAALDAAPELLARNRARIERHVALANEFFGTRGDRFDWRPPQAGSVALVGVDHASATAFCEQLAREHGIVLLPSSFLGYDDWHVRFGFGREGFAEALEAFAATLDPSGDMYPLECG